LIVFDAHADCKDNLTGNFSKLNNVNWLKNLIIDDYPPEHIVLVGLREMEKAESDFLANHRIRYYKMKDLIDYTEICDIIMELANKFMIYISVDIDVVDAAFVPGTARPEIGGMTGRRLLCFLQRLNILKSVKGIDICEINPEIDFKENTVKLGSKILGEII
jgi:arginase family enzyme